jgi:hypothetical protein
MGCGRSLHRHLGGAIRCYDASCPRPAAAAEILADSETEHIVLLEEDTFTIRHPLRERLDDALMECALHELVAGTGAPSGPPGRYRVTMQDGGWAWERIG